MQKSGEGQHVRGRISGREKRIIHVVSHVYATEATEHAERWNSKREAAIVTGLLQRVAVGVQLVRTPEHMFES